MTTTAGVAGPRATSSRLPPPTATGTGPPPATAAGALPASGRGAGGSGCGRAPSAAGAGATQLPPAATGCRALAAAAATSDGWRTALAPPAAGGAGTAEMLAPSATGSSRLDCEAGTLILGEPVAAALSSAASWMTESMPTSSAGGQGGPAFLLLPSPVTQILQAMGRAAHQVLPSAPECSEENMRASN